VDHRLASGVDLPAQVGDVQLDDVGLPAEVVRPHAVQDLRLAQHAARIAHEEPQQLELGGGEVDAVAAPGDLVAVLVEGEVADDQDGVGAPVGGAGAADQSAQPGDDLLQAERLGDVVVPAGGQPGDAVLDRVLGGQEQHRHVRQVAAQPPQHAQTVHVRQHHVQHDGVGPELAGGLDGAVPVPGAADLPALVAQGHGQQLGDGQLVVHHKHPDGAPVRPQQFGAPLGRGRGHTGHHVGAL
jgi:hypothetical protein